MFLNQKYVVSNICRRGGNWWFAFYFASLFRFQFCDPSLLFPFKYVFTSSLPIPTYLGAYLILSFRSLCPLRLFSLYFIPKALGAVFARISPLLLSSTRPLSFYSVCQIGILQIEAAVFYQETLVDSEITIVDTRNKFDYTLSQYFLGSIPE